MNPLQLLQTELDNLLFDDGVHVYWQRKAESDHPEEYVVYALNGDASAFSADDSSQASNTGMTVRYYYRNDLLDNYESRIKIQDRVFLLVDALRNTECFAVSGAFDIGMMDETGYAATDIELSYVRKTDD